MYATHYHRADRRPFLNLSDLDERDVDRVLSGLPGGSRRRFGPHYVALRRATEERARELFIAAGGRPVRDHPHYFVLGSSAWFAGLYDDPREIRVPLSRLPAELTSFTRTDSITALGLGRHLGVPQPTEPWKQDVHRLDQLDGAVAGVPGDYDGYQHRLLDSYVEIQLWSDAPIAEHLVGE